eukprot:SAG31_NODE_8263_length_1486_cov_1.250901_2_plen_148_part_00
MRSHRPFVAPVSKRSRLILAVLVAAISDVDFPLRGAMFGGVQLPVADAQADTERVLLTLVSQSQTRDRIAGPLLPYSDDHRFPNASMLQITEASTAQLSRVAPWEVIAPCKHNCSAPRISLLLSYLTHVCFAVCLPPVWLHVPPNPK